MSESIGRLRAWRQTGFVWKTHGGARKGAGRKPKGGRAGASHGRRGRLGGREPVHVSLSARREVPSLRSQVCFAALRRAFVAGKERFGFRLVQFSVQGTHVHMLVEADDARALARGMKGLAVRMARGINRAVGRTGSVFAERYHAEPLGSPRQVRRALVYVLRNDAKHDVQAGGRPSSELDGCSSAAYFDGWRARACRPVDEDSPVVAAGTWLLARGWKRLGLIESFELPRLGERRGVSPRRRARRGRPS